MHRRTLLTAPLLLAAGPAPAQTRPGQPQPRPTPAAPPPSGPAQLTAQDRADLTRIEQYLNSLGSLKARFVQIAQNGAAAEGTAWIVRPGRMRFEYDPPEPLLLVANAGQFFYYDKELKQVSVVPVGSTPLGLLLRPDMRFTGDVTISRVERVQGFLRISLFRTGQAAEGQLTLVFGDTPLELRQWAVVDAQGRETRVTLFNIERGGRFESLLFEFNNPIFREQLGIP